MKAVQSEYIRDMHFSTAADFLKSIAYGGELYGILNKNFIYRGHYSDKYMLVPYALRDNVWDDFNIPHECKNEIERLVSELEYTQILNEYNILHRFYNLCDINKLWVPMSARMRNSVITSYDETSMFIPEKWLPEEFWELAALAQHYGLPTRLLDWSTNINTALYFAVRDYIKPLTTYQQLSLQREMLANKGNTVDKNMELWALDARVIIRKEDTLPLRIIRPAYSGNPNLSAQEGVFTLWQIDKPITRDTGSEKVSMDFDLVDRSPLDKLLADKLQKENIAVHPYMYYITIPQSQAVEIYLYLERLNHTAAKLFPGYAGAAMSLKEGAGFLKKINKVEAVCDNGADETDGVNE